MSSFLFPADRLLYTPFSLHTIQAGSLARSSHFEAGALKMSSCTSRRKNLRPRYRSQVLPRLECARHGIPPPIIHFLHRPPSPSPLLPGRITQYFATTSTALNQADCLVRRARHARQPPCHDARRRCGHSAIRAPRDRWRKLVAASGDDAVPEGGAEFTSLEDKVDVSKVTHGAETNQPRAGGPGHGRR